ncbi:GDYXXLXY domain-containing protein [Ascidiimonas aurantiaca]|uniref:GDYXXLXY domain-containing protein n=1 Tax=Ascidiimonas aurantiaca TaxID=1685432 RepID=UPI0030EE231D
MKKRWVFIFFIALAFIQLSVPGYMIYTNEDTFRNGEAFKFVIRPVDPTDPFRGEYITLSFALNEFETEEKGWKYNSDIFIALDRDENGIAVIKSVSSKAPSHTEVYIKAKVTGYYEGKVSFQLPFNRFYMKEYRAYEAERLFREQVREGTGQDHYAIVFIKKGHALIADVFLDGTSVNKIYQSSK